MKTYERKRPFKRCTRVDLDFGKICRLCLCTGGDRQNIFDIQGDVPFPLKIQTCLSIEVHEGDGLPAEVCLKCIKLLETFYRFRKKCEEVNSKVNDISKKVKVQSQAKTVIQKQEENGKLNIVDLLCSAGKEVEGEVILNNSACVMDSLIIDCESNDNGVSENPRIKSISNDNTLIISEERNETVTVTKSVSLWQSESNSSQVEHFQNSDSILSSNENTSYSNMRNVFTKNCISNSSVDNSKSPLCDLIALPATSTGLIFVCDKCPKGFSKRIDLKRHSSVHDQQRGFVCGECEKWFPNKASFKRHERIHTGERPFCCSYCQKCFSQETILSRHVLIHTGEKQYKCETCGKRFTQKDGLRVHSRRHDHGNQNVQQQQYYCPLCKKGFCHQSGLSRHLITHTGKTFDCQVCSKSFSDQSSLKRHTKRHNTIKSELCS